jgi:hypothetical protein
LIDSFQKCCPKLLIAKGPITYNVRLDPKLNSDSSCEYNDCKLFFADTLVEYICTNYLDPILTNPNSDIAKETDNAIANEANNATTNETNNATASEANNVTTNETNNATTNETNNATTNETNNATANETNDATAGKPNNEITNELKNFFLDEMRDFLSCLQKMLDKPLVLDKKYTDGFNVFFSSISNFFTKPYYLYKLCKSGQHKKHLSKKNFKSTFYAEFILLWNSHMKNVSVNF